MSTAAIIDGKTVAETIHQETALRVSRLKEAAIQPKLAFVRVGDDPASKVYVGMKEKTSSRLGLASDTTVLPEKASESELLALLAKLNADPSVHGILVQAPLPGHIDAARIYSAVLPEKDVDGFHPINAGKLMLGDPTGFRPCTPAGIHELLIRSGVQIEGAEVVILGRGNIVGKPMASILLQKARNANATVTVCHGQTRDIATHCRRGDILIAAIGSPLFVTARMVKPGAVVIDVGVNRIADAASTRGSKLVGDVEFDEVVKVAGKITPNPGGVGPMTIAILMRNTVQAAESTLR